MSPIVEQHGSRISIQGNSGKRAKRGLTPLVSSARRHLGMQDVMADAFRRMWDKSTDSAAEWLLHLMRLQAVKVCEEF